MFASTIEYMVMIDCMKECMVKQCRDRFQTCLKRPVTRLSHIYIIIGVADTGDNNDLLFLLEPADYFHDAPL